MRITILSAAAALVLCTNVAVADPYPTCTDAYNEGHNTVANFVSASYNRAGCNRDVATQYEGFMTSVIPFYLASFARATTEANGACMLQGSYHSWLETTKGEYGDCGTQGFLAIERGLLGTIAGTLLREFYLNSPGYYGPDQIAAVFAFPYFALPLSGTSRDCRDSIDESLAGTAPELNSTLKATVCQW